MLKKVTVLYELVPIALHDALTAFRAELQKIASRKIDTCPHCGGTSLSTPFLDAQHRYRCHHCHRYSTSATHTPFSRLSALTELDTLFVARIEMKSYLTIAEELHCSRRQVIRRYKILLAYLKSRYIALYNWCIAERQTTLSQAVNQQHQLIHDKVNALLHAENPTCIHCGSNQTIKKGTRTCYRCKKCRNTFNLLAKTPLNRLPRIDLWLTFIDLITARYTNRQISHHLNFNKNTVARWRRHWCAMMRQWHCWALAMVCI